MDDQFPAIVAPLRKGHRFAKGHPKFGGRKKREHGLASAIEVCLQEAINPITEMVRIYRSGVLKDASGREHPVDSRSRVKLLCKVAEYTFPRAPELIAGRIDHEHTLNTSAVMRNPDLARKVEDAVIALLDAENDGALTLEAAVMNDG